jgi:hypothetical protein
MKPATELLRTYRALLEQAASRAPTAERALYDDHRAALGRLDEALGRGALDEAAAIVARERRTFGWSFLEGLEGRDVERAFADLAAALEGRAGRRSPP